MKRIELKVIILAFLLSLLMYPQIINTLYAYGENLYNIILLESNEAKIQLNRACSKEKIKISIIFDDGWDSVYTKGYQIFKRFGFHANISIVPGLVGEKEYLDDNQLTYLYIKGWELLNHSYTHTDGMYDKPNELLSDFNRARKWMSVKYLDNSKDICVLPYGEINPCLIKKLKENDYRCIRTSDNILILDEYQIKYREINSLNLLTEMTVEEAIEYLNNSYENKDDVMIILHKLGEGADESGMTYSVEKLTKLLGYIYENSDKFHVVGFSELLIEH